MAATTSLPRVVSHPGDQFPDPMQRPEGVPSSGELPQVPLNRRIRSKTKDPLYQDRGSDVLNSNDTGSVIDIEARAVRTVSRGKRTLVVSPWLASFTVRLHESHALGHKRGIIWCWKCGSFSVTKIDKLGIACPGGTRRKSYGLSCLKRLRKGKTPRHDLRWPRGESELDDAPPDVVILARAAAPAINILPFEEKECSLATQGGVRGASGSGDR